ncbi:hypothetical protein KKC13_07265 [bacterium]|nr:hypothetical protein [bacterium]MBU1958934.1 hypothetical protein [bacterium]
MKNKIYLLLAGVISVLPLSAVRTNLYRLIFGFKIHQSKIGWLTVLNVDNVTMNNASIGALNFFTGPFDVEMKEGSSIGGLNFFRCGRWASGMQRVGKLLLKEEAIIVNQHYFDLFGTVSIGKKSLIAGVRSQFWTHGSISSDVDIVIGDNCYVGSGVKVAAGSTLANDSVCAMGSVLTKKFKQENILIAGVPAKIIRENVNWRENWK